MKKHLFLCFLVLSILLSSCANADTPKEKLGGIHTAQGDVYPEEFLTFDHYKVSFDEFRYFYLNYKNMYLEENPSYFETEGTQEALKEEVLKCLLDSWAIRFLAEENKVRLSSDEKKAVEQSIEEAKQVFGSEEAFLEDLHAAFMSVDYYENMMEYSSLYYKLFNTLFEDGGKEAYTDEEFYEFYKANYLAIQQIYLPFSEGEDKENCTETMALAESIRQKAVSGEDFWSLVKTYGKDENMPDYPDGYYITEGQAEEVLYESAKALAIDEISRPVVGKTGVYIMKRLELKKLRMDENRDTALFGYRDSLDEWHPGEYDRVFRELYGKRAEKISVKFSDYWDLVSSETVF